MRFYYLDWLRAFGFYCIMIVHCISSAYDANEISRKNDPVTTEKKEGMIKTFVQYALPLTIYISRVCMSFYDTEKSSFFKFTMERVKRLLMPMGISIFIFLIPRLYLG